MKELTIFDLDNTLLKEQSQKALLGYLLRKGLIDPFFYLKVMTWFIFYKIGLVRNPKKIMEYSFKFLKGTEETEFIKIIDSFFENKLHNYVFKKGLELIKEHKNKNRKILIVSNSIKYIPEKIADFLGIDYFIGTELETKMGKFTGRLNGDIIYGKNKVLAIKRFLKENNFSLKGSWGYSDHHSDIPLLEIVDNPVAVNPTKKLYKKAKAFNWSIEIFKETIN